MAYLECFLSDAENLLDEVSRIHITNELDIYNKYKQAVIIQKWFRGYITRKHIKYLHAQATIIQKNWRGFCGRHTYYLLLKKTVKEFHEKNYNHLATIIQKTWRGYLYRKYVFSYIKLKQWKNLILKKNKFCLQLTKNWNEVSNNNMKSLMDCEAEKWLFYILFKAHHLLRTYQMKGIYSTKGNSKKYSLIEELMNSLEFTSYMKQKQKQDRIEKIHKTKHYSSYMYKFQGKKQECERAWVQRYAPNFYSVFSSGIYQEEEELSKFRQFLEQDALILHEKPMQFGLISPCNDTALTLEYKDYKCPPNHKTVLIENEATKKSISENSKARIKSQKLEKVTENVRKLN